MEALAGSVMVMAAAGDARAAGVLDHALQRGGAVLRRRRWRQQKREHDQKKRAQNAAETR